jgi:hypothetical protein
MKPPLLHGFAKRLLGFRKLGSKPFASVNDIHSARVVSLGTRSDEDDVGSSHEIGLFSDPQVKVRLIQLVLGPA